MPRKFPLLVLVLGLLLTPVAAFAQNAVIMGVVRTETQQPVSGALVAIPAVEATTVTNEYGQYRIVVPANRVTGQQVQINVTSIGYSDGVATITLRAGTINQNIIMSEQAIQLDEVVVTGTVGRTERRAQAAVVSSINAARVAQTAPVQTVSNLLQARTPGVVLTTNSGTSGTATTIRIRGQSSISLSNEPLIFVDGVRISGGSQQLYGVGGQQGSRLNDIKIEDIESMEVVKGPAAATLYGSDANAGVINIITKKGRAGSGFTQTITAEYGQAEPNFTPPDNVGVCSAAALTSSTTPACHGKQVGDIITDNPLARTDPFGTGRYRNLMYALTGGGERFSTYFSVGADDENGTLPNNEYGHISSRASFSFFPHEKLSMEFGFGIVQVTTQLPRNDNDIYGFLGGAFLGDPRTLGGPKDGWYGNNRPASVIALYENVDETTRFNPRLSMSYSPWTWFTNRFMVGGDMTRTEGYQFWAKNDIGFWDSSVLNTGQIGEARRAEDRFTIEYLGNVTRQVNDDLRLDLSFGSQAQTRRSDLTSVTGNGLVTNETRSVNAAATLGGGGQSSSQDRSIGVFSQATFSWREKLYLQLGGRRDQASAFGAESKPYYQPKVGLSYMISEESYFQNLTDFLPENAITQLRLRGAWGVTGRQPNSGARSTYSPTTNQITATTVGVGVTPGATGNPRIRPERGEEIELGLDASFMSDRVGLEFTYFRKETTDQILGLPVPGSQGASGPDVNIGALLNSGIEVAANARVLTRENVALELRGSMNTLRNELLDLGTVPESATRKVGFPLNGVWDYAIKEVDLVNNRVIVSDTLEFIGNSGNLPGWDMSASSTLTLFQDLSFYLQLDGRGDRVIFNNTDQFRDRQNGFSPVNVYGPAAFGTNSDGTPTEAAKIKYMRLYGCIVQAGDPCTSTAAWTTTEGRTLSRTTVRGDYNEDGSFIRLREAAVNYRIPNRIVQQYMRARSASVGLTMRNLNMWTDFRGFDPETDQFLTVPQDKRWTVRFLFTF